MTAPVATPTGVAPDSDAFLCPVDCTMGWVTISHGHLNPSDGTFHTRDVPCDDCSTHCGPNGYVDEVPCWDSDCKVTLTPETTAGLDGDHPLCAECFKRWAAAGRAHPVFQCLLDLICARWAA